MLALILFINYVDRGALPTAAHLVQLDLHLDDAQLGLLFSAFFWSYSLVQVPVGWLAERYGAHRVLAGGLVLWATATIGLGFAHSFPVLLGLRLLLGIGESAGFPCVSKLLAAVVPIPSLGRANGVVAFGYLTGPAVGVFVGGYIMDAYGWRATFWIFGSLSLLWLVPWLKMKLPPLAVRRSDADKPDTRTLLRQTSLWGTALGLFSSNYVFYFMLSWLPLYLVRERGFTTLEMARIASMAFLFNSVSAAASGFLLDKLIASGLSANVVHKSNMAMTHAGSVLCMLVMAVGPHSWALGGIFLYQVLCGLQSPGCYAIPQILAGPRATGRWVGIQNSVGNFAGIVSTAATGFIVNSTHAFTGAFLLAGAMSLLGLIGWLWMLPTLRQLDWGEAPAVSPAVASAA